MEKKGAGGLNKAIERLEAKLKENDFYEATQLVKLLSFRYKTQNKIEDCESLLITGIEKLATQGKAYQCCSELGGLLLEVYVSNKIPVDDDHVAKITKIYNLYPKNEDIGKVNFLNSALNWSQGQGVKNGYSGFHDLLADWFDTEARVASSLNDSITTEQEEEQSTKTSKPWREAIKHYVKGTSNSTRTQQFSDFLLLYSRHVLQSERDLLIARVVFEYSSLGNLKDANIMYESYCKTLSSQPELKFDDTPLIHFIGFLLATLQRDAWPLFVLLNDKYKPSLERDPAFAKLLDKTAQTFFHKKLTPQAGGMSGMINNMLSALLNPN